MMLLPMFRYYYAAHAAAVTLRQMMLRYCRFADAVTLHC